MKATKPHEFQSSTNLKWLIAELFSQKIPASLNALLIGEKTKTTKINITTLTTKAEHYKSAERFGIQ
ncbi:hypothetical protein, partial [Vibrio sp. 10N.261.55.A7]|uniref:hypothetical protein n=1 Tax=Vibrio sp. 10N.261.55.A7 TaxID=1880851 RepID=UPI001A7E0BBB